MEVSSVDDLGGLPPARGNNMKASADSLRTRLTHGVTLAAESVGSWFAPDDDQLRVWRGRAMQPRSDDGFHDNLLGNMEEEDEDESATPKPRTRPVLGGVTSRSRSSFRALSGIFNQNATTMPVPSAPADTTDDVEEDPSDSDSQEIEEEARAQVQNDHALAVALQEENIVRQIERPLEDGPRQTDVTNAHLRQFYLDLRRQYQNSKPPPKHYLYASWFESNAPLIPEGSAPQGPTQFVPALDSKQSLRRGTSKKHVELPAIENEQRKTLLMRHQLRNPPPVTKAAPRYTKHGDRLKRLDNATAAKLAAAQHKHPPLFNNFSVLVMFCMVVLELCVGGVVSIGFGVSYHTRNVQVFGEPPTAETRGLAQNMWIGPNTLVLVHLGAKYSPCMKRNDLIQAAIERQRLEYEVDASGNTIVFGCCLLQDNTCSQTSNSGCVGLLGFESWSQNTTCQSLNCNIVNRPCCVGLLGECELMSVDACKFVVGWPDMNHELCQDVPSCLETVCGMGGFNNPGEPNQWWRFITPIFLHVGILHFTFNVLFQLSVGPQIEASCGTLRFFLIFMISGIGGNIVSAIFSPYGPQAGSSGALYGAMAVLIVEMFQSWKILQHPWLALLKHFIVFLVSTIIGTLPWIDNYAHLGGFFFGLVAGVVFLPNITFGKWDSQRKKLLLLVSIPLLLVMIIMGFVIFYLAGSNFCSFCHYVNCIPYSSTICSNVAHNWDGRYH